jgi:very-short-patch-repair endonuclease
VAKTPADECRRRGGAIRTSELRRAGFTAREIGAAVRGGLLVRARRGMHVLPETAADAVEALGHRGLVACATAARAHGLWTFDGGGEEPTHVWVDPHRHPARVGRRPESDDVRISERVCRCILHRDAAIDEGGPLLVGLLHCLLQLAHCLGGEAFFAALESALQLGLISPAGRWRLRTFVPPAMAWLVDFAHSASESGLESLLRLRLAHLGISMTAQVAIPGVGRVDFVIGGCLILEADGKENHEGNRRHRDLRRDALTAAMGYVTLRFDSALIMHEWPVVEAAILGALDRRTHMLPVDGPE